MSTNVTLNGSVYSIPAVGDSNWGTPVSNYLIAIASGVLQKSGGSFSLTAETDFGTTYGLKSAYYKSRAANPSGVGIVRLGNNEAVSWRNAGNTADLALAVNASNKLQFNSVDLVDASSSQNLSGKSFQDNNTLFFDDTDSTKKFAFNASSITTGTTRIYSMPNANGTFVLSGSIANGDISDVAAIALSKLEALTASRALVSNGSGVISVSATTATELGYVSGVTSAIQTQINTKAPSASPTFTGTVTTPVTASRALTTNGSSQLAASATTATELGYVSGVTSAIQTQINTKAPSASPTFTGTVTTPVTASRAVVTGASSELSASATTATELGYLSGVTSAVQTQINSKLATTITTTGDLIYSSSGTTASRLAIGATDTMRLKVASGVPSWGFPTTASKTTTYAITTADEVLRFDTSGGAFTATLPTAVGIAGKTYTLKLSTAGNILTIATTSAQTIDGLASLKMATAGDFGIVQSDGANWILIGDNINYTATYSTNVGQTVSASATLTLVDFEDMVSDPLGLVTTGAGWAYTAIRPGMYEVSALLSPITNAGADTNILDISTYVNGVSSNIFRRYMDPNANRINSIAIPATPFRLSVSQTIKIYWRSYYTTVSPVLYNQNPYNYVSIKRVGN